MMLGIPWRPASGADIVPLFFALTLFVSATLLFLVQPMVGKMVLPLLGGTPAVWNTCMVFFQALLLAGYYYAHRVTSAYDSRRQTSIHLPLLGACIVILAAGAILSANHSPIPIAKGLAPQGQDYPFFGVIALLAVAIALPFFAVSTSAPLLQKWFGYTGHRSAKDPYFLYAASNVGSLLALVAYPILVEPNLKLAEQAWLWGLGFIGLVVMTYICARLVVNAPPPKPSAGSPAPTKRSSGVVTPPANLSGAAKVERSQSAAKPQMAQPVGAAEEAAPALGQKLRWLALAFVPSSLMLSVTTFISTDIASLPLLWIIPLALYLVTFIIAFSRVPAWFHLIVTLLAPVLILLLIFVTYSDTKPGFAIILLLHMATFFAVALVCHGELARSRPPAKWLTSFYLIMSLGGMLGGLFNSLVAPIVFNFVSEYPITLVAACLLLPRLAPAPKEETRSFHLFGFIPGPRGQALREQTPGLRLSVYDVFLPLGVFALCRLLAAYRGDIIAHLGWLTDLTNLNRGALWSIIAYGVPAMISYFFVERPIRFGLSVAAIILSAHITYLKKSDDPDDHSRILVQERSYFGTLKVSENDNFIWLVHGTTLHGEQRRNPDETAAASAVQALGAGGPLDAATLSAMAWEDWQFPGREPLTYYHRTGPVGSMFEAFWQRHPKNTNLACIGLGTGSLSAYGRPGQTVTFFEIDTKVRRLVEPPTYFTYIDSAKKQGVDIEFIMGDARLSLERLEGRKFGFMLVDAFSSDAIPVHLLTKEAVQLYFDRLEDDGLLAVHISNRYLDLEPVVDRIAKELNKELGDLSNGLGVEARVMHDDDDSTPAKTRSTWIVLARTKEALGPIEADTQRWLAEGGQQYTSDNSRVSRRWVTLNPKGRDVGLWTDDYSPIKRVLNFSIFKED
jgi:spermidine synthase